MKVYLLGSLELVDDEGRKIEIRAAKQQLLLLALALRPGRTVTTSQLIDTLWDGAAPASAVNLVQGYVAELRKRLGPARIETRSDGYVLAVAPDDVDVSRFEALHDQAGARAARGDPAGAALLLDAALALWRGPALGGAALPDALAPLATRLDELRLTATEDRLAVALDVGKHTEVVAKLEELATTNPYRERLWGQLVLALYRSGRQADALRRLATLRSRLLDDLGVSPGPALEQLESQILHHAPELVVAPAPARANAAPIRRAARGDGAFVGRAAEMDRLMGRWRQVNGGTWQTVLVGGEPGIGKTRLLMELAGRLDSQGAIVLYGRCDEDVFAPYQPFAESLGSFFATNRAEPVHRALSDRLGPAGLGVLGDLVPGLPAASQPQPAPGEQRTMLWIFDAFITVIGAVATVAPVVLVLDDLHWADSSTLGLLRHVSRRNLDSGVLLLGAYRDTDIEAVHPLRDLLADLRAEPTCEQLTLSGLSVLEIEQLLVEVQERAGLGSAEALRRRTGGNPLFLGEMVRHQAQSGEVGTPAGVAEVIVRRIRRLSGDAQRILRLASVLGEEFDVETLRELAQPQSGWVADGLEEAIELGLLVELGATAPPRCAFTHSVVRSVVYSALSTLRRQDMHALAAATMERILGRSIDQHRAAIASHYRAAGRAAEPEQALSAFIAAAEQADRTWAKDEAVRWYDAALELLPDNDPGRSRLRLTRFVAAQTAWHWHYDQLSISRSKQAEQPDPLAREVGRVDVTGDLIDVVDPVTAENG
jgi:DNA-binding SARP family transcriptional activator/tetratricopeptide (TPR) repeat protein